MNVLKVLPEANELRYDCSEGFNINVWWLYL